ncbi:MULTISPECIES: hypothetical protein [Vibrio]|uniref:Uncharacterized protein n=1 Tax=Vibrio algicola TaxID=2662262 RepID=A0A5Q0TIY1_9VIBR|nr:MULTISPECIES: hypothetical protein [Vibrio]MBD1575923.1 hypothetical protein [Vibrio sp. S11_S32]
MTELMTPQENALATFKSNLHLPNGGFHALIVELAREFQLPFHTVKPVLKKSQKVVEKKITNDFENIAEHDLSQENWLALIRSALITLVEQNVPLMVSLTQNQDYNDAIAIMAKASITHSEQQQVLEHLAMAYEMQVYKPLTAMLYTSILYWKISDDLYQVTPQTQQEFSGYPQHLEAINHLLKLSEQVKAMKLTD